MARATMARATMARATMARATMARATMARLILGVAFALQCPMSLDFARHQIFGSSRKLTGGGTATGQHEKCWWYDRLANGGRLRSAAFQHQQILLDVKS